MYKKIILFFSLVVILVNTKALFAQEENVWLHVEGTEIKNGRGEVFIAVGQADNRHNERTGPEEEIVRKWKEKGVNTIRFSLHTVEKIDNIDKFIKEFIDPMVQACKDYGIYVYLDQHEYLRDYLSSDDWMPSGEVWGEKKLQKWIDHWVAIANRYKDEPWVMGYELLNEPGEIDPDLTRDLYTRVLKAIREVDKKHIIFLGNCRYDHSSEMERTWGKVKFRPDEPYNNVVFAFHEYTHADDPYRVFPMLDRVKSKYKVPVFCTEFGADETIPGLTMPERRTFEKDMFEMFKLLKCGWTIWGNEWEELWVPAAKDQGSPSPLKVTGKLEVTATPSNVVLDGTSMAKITATFMDNAGKQITNSSEPVEFSLKGEGVIEGANPTPAVNGVASVKIRASKLGTLRVVAHAKEHLPVLVDVGFKSGTMTKLTGSANPASITADAKAKTEITYNITDSFGNKVDYGYLYRVNCAGGDYIDNTGQLWLADKKYSEGSWGHYGSPSNKPNKAETKNTEDQILFQTAAQGGENFGYKFSVPNGIYKVDLYFCENYWGSRNTDKNGIGGRVFDIKIEDDLVLKDYDICAKAGPNTADKYTFTVKVNDGDLVISVPKVKADSAEIAAIAVTADPSTVTLPQVSFSLTGTDCKLFGLNPATPVGGMVKIGLVSTGTTSGKAKVTASMNGLTPGSVNIDIGKGGNPPH
ncbi:MAG: hypothetical protein A3J83_09065 [Elusimicrobia bacterium RIFOXYA2_FULL_40_6]|nr:MAG: hypothetical protein A3J83_09065 [Elusimicrobia bacterium RIFOXYA2_FULL_40_6]